MAVVGSVELHYIRAAWWLRPADVSNAITDAGNVILSPFGYRLINPSITEKDFTGIYTAGVDKFGSPIPVIIVAFFAGLVVAGVIFYYFAWKPLAQKAEVQTKTIEDVKAELEEAQRDGVISESEAQKITAIIEEGQAKAEEAGTPSDWFKKLEETTGLVLKALPAILATVVVVSVLGIVASVIKR